MTSSTLEITAPSRLHFGMFSFGRADGRQFGGVGAMIDRPGIRVRISSAAKLQAHGSHADRALTFARLFAKATERDAQLLCRIEVLSAPPQHVGLGVGTQLGLAVARGLDVMFDGGNRTSPELARLVGRGERSAVGVHGFAHGGLIVEEGKQSRDTISPLVSTHAIPDPWRFVLIRPQDAGGLHGAAERAAFASLPPISEETTRQLTSEVQQRMLPALKAADFDGFSESVYRFGRAAGECFRPVQGGAYNGPLLGELVAAIRARGVDGVGQTSWGPTLYCLFPHLAAAKDFVAAFQTENAALTADITISSPYNGGAQIERFADSPKTRTSRAGKA